MKLREKKERARERERENRKRAVESSRRVSRVSWREVFLFFLFFFRSFSRHPFLVFQTGDFQKSYNLNEYLLRSGKARFDSKPERESKWVAKHSISLCSRRRCFLLREWSLEPWEWGQGTTRGRTRPILVPRPIRSTSITNRSNNIFNWLIRKREDQGSTRFSAWASISQLQRQVISLSLSLSLSLSCSLLILLPLSRFAKCLPKPSQNREHCIFVYSK